MAEILKCALCGKNIIWARSSLTGVFMPLDTAPTKDGTVFLIDGTAQPIQRSLVEQFIAGRRYRHHLDTCKKSPLKTKAKDEMFS